mmetsp:Transcript_104722/g.327608  ORF Transcript_104722/g.327608 Transcript_104722/m.327608 type:complete len:277 (-) Transcript_104722:45-875(-)
MKPGALRLGTFTTAPSRTPKCPAESTCQVPVDLPPMTGSLSSLNVKVVPSAPSKVASFTSAAAAAAAEVKLATFDGAEGTTFTFKELNDPVMGGKSTGTWHVDSAGHFGVLDGAVVNVPSLKAPGFIKAAADGSFPDASSALAGDLVLTVRSSTPEYKGFRVSFVSGTLSPGYACAGGGSIPLSRGCFKAKFSVPAGGDFVTVRVPFHDFSDKWSPATGEQTTTCAQDASVCPTAKTLGGIKRVELWAEGADGKVHLEVQSVSAVVGGSEEALMVV